MFLVARRASALMMTGLLLSLTGCGLAQSLQTEGDLPAGQSSAFSVVAGDCLNDSGQTDVLTVPVVDCTVPHDLEAFATATMPDGDFPGEEAITEFAEESCAAAFVDFVGVPADETRLSFTHFSPLEPSWARGDREVLCLVGDPKGPVSEPLEGMGPAYPTG